MTFYSLGVGNRYLGDSQTRCRNSCLALKGHAGHLWPAFSLPRSGFLEMPGWVEAETAGPTSCSPSAPLASGELRPAAGLGPSLSAVFSRRAPGPLALFSASRNTVKALLRLRERLQSAPLRLFGGFLSLDPGEAVEGQGKTEARVGCSSGCAVGTVRCTGCPRCRIMGIGMGGGDLHP